MQEEAKEREKRKKNGRRDAGHRHALGEEELSLELFSDQIYTHTHCERERPHTVTD